MATAAPATSSISQITEIRSAAIHRVLIIGEDKSVQAVLHDLISSEGYDVEIASNTFSMVEMLLTKPPSVVILDLPQPASSACDLYRQIVRSAPGVPVLVLSTNSNVVDKVVLLELGADDYVTVPFNGRELIARLRAVMRRNTRLRPRPFCVFEDVIVDFSRMEVTRGGENVALTLKEFRTLEFLTKNVDRVVSREEFLNEVWGYKDYPCTRTVDNHILRLRQKLESNPGEPSHLLTIHGAGYKFVP
jgi:DNA-binding response OmpR family regulator